MDWRGKRSKRVHNCPIYDEYQTRLLSKGFDPTMRTGLSNRFQKLAHILYVSFTSISILVLLCITMINHRMSFKPQKREASLRLAYISWGILLQSSWWAGSPGPKQLLTEVCIHHKLKSCDLWVVKRGKQGIFCSKKENRHILSQE